MKWIGIDTGTHTGLAVWDDRLKELTSLETIPIHRAMSRVLELSSTEDVFVIFEDARQRTWFGKDKNTSAKLQGAGSSRGTAAFGRTSSTTMRYHSGQFHHRKVAPSGMTNTSRWSQGGKERHLTIPGMQQSLCLASNRKDGFYILKCEDKDRNN